MGILLFVLFMGFYVFHPLCLSLGKPYGGLRPLRPSESVLFLCGQQHGVKFLHVITLSRVVIQWQVGVICAIVMGRLWTTF